MWFVEVYSAVLTKILNVFYLSVSALSVLSKLKFVNSLRQILGLQIVTSAPIFLFYKFCDIKIFIIDPADILAKCISISPETKESTGL